MMRRSRPRPLDWVTSEAGYGMTLPPILLPCNSIPDEYALTGWVDLLDEDADIPQPRYQFPQLEQTVIRIVGKVWMWILPADSWWDTLTGRAAAKVRFSVGPQFIGSAVVVPDVNTPSYFTPQAGNMDIMWENTQVFIAQSAWGDIQVDPAMYVREIPIDITVKRRISHSDLLKVGFHYIGVDYAGAAEAFPDMAIDMELRVLLKTIT